ncbi:MAG: hypothetical protein AAFN10_22035 [Bacteroidota bacterium]
MSRNETVGRYVRVSGRYYCFAERSSMVANSSTVAGRVHLPRMIAIREGDMRKGRKKSQAFREAAK